MKQFSGRRALVTGGASGIGLATARLLCKQGANVVLLDRHAETLKKAAAELDVARVTCDVTEPAALDRAVAGAASELGGAIDVLINAAGVYRIEPAVEITPVDWSEVLDINLRGSFLAARAVTRALIEAEQRGSIVNVASISALRGYAAEPAAHYSASKAGVVAMTRQLAVEWARHGIRVNAVCPGVIDTPMLRARGYPEQGEEYLRGSVPLGRMGTAEEVASCVAFLASDMASYVTGAALPIDGGATAA